ncbi:MAG: phosphatase PAP2 family protein [Alistipes sp.]
MQTLDHDLFMTLNFDGGATLDRLMLLLSGTLMWLPLYALIAWLVWRQEGWRRMLLFLALMLAALALADMVAGIFKHNGLLGGMLPDFVPRPRPMFAPTLEGLDISPDSLRTLRQAEIPCAWAVHVPREAVSGLYGTVSAHASTIVALAVLAASVIRRRWFTALMVLSSLAICYSRIYLGKHYPMDLIWGALLGLLLGLLAVWIFRRLTRCTLFADKGRHPQSVSGRH